jgi:cytochrome c-type biogenesis protein CcmH
MSAEDRASMIRSMVESLDAKMSENPDNIEGWLRLVRSYAVLGDQVRGANGARTSRNDIFTGASDGGRALGRTRSPAGTLEQSWKSQ